MQLHLGSFNHPIKSLLSTIDCGRHLQRFHDGTFNCRIDPTMALIHASWFGPVQHAYKYSCCLFKLLLQQHVYDTGQDLQIFSFTFLILSTSSSSVSCILFTIQELLQEGPVFQKLGTLGCYRCAYDACTCMQLRYADTFSFTNILFAESLATWIEVPGAIYSLITVYIYMP